MQRRAASRAFGATEQRLRVEILGEYAAPAGETLPPAADGRPRVAKYQAALDGGHTVVPLIHEVWGGLAPGAVRYLRTLGRERAGRLDTEGELATWATTSFTAFYGQLIALAIFRKVACTIRAARGRAHGDTMRV